ncbi:HD domain-containing protein [Hymenobacter sp. B1770]|uniref:HD domain-containing protein n=1 Tax=Hymenobacter sp. B1770 TaxID=1718788 RepID=UPI003CE90A00
MYTLAARWHRLTAPLVPDAAPRELAYQALASAYQASGRHYHTLQHIENLLNRLERAPLHDAPVVQLAVWFHDAVYNPLRSDNEARSAVQARAFLATSALEPAQQQRVAFLIERTHDHTLPQPSDDSDLLYFLDADLSILGASEADYWAYARQVRQEYRLVPDLLYRPGRQKILAKMLAAPVLYHTPAMRQELDAAARRNLQAELHAWERGGL